MKKAVVALGRRRYSSACKNLFSKPKLTQRFNTQLKKAVLTECQTLTSTGFKTMFQTTNVKSLDKINFQGLFDEMQKHAPVVTTILSTIAKRNNKENNNKFITRCIIAYSMLINNRNHQLNVIQKLMSILLYKSKVRVKVYC